MSLNGLSAQDRGLSPGLLLALIFFFSTLLCIASAQGWKFVDRSQVGISDTPLDIDGAEEVAEGSDETELLKYGILEVEPEESGKFEGDIANDFGGKSVQEWVEDQNDPKKNAIRGTYNHWANGATNLGTTREIPYVIDKAVQTGGRDVIARAMKAFHDQTCVRFVPRKSQGDYLHIKALGEGCYSYVGRMGGSQVVNLDVGCYVKGTVMHELMHAVGFFHEHSRNDRDDWITIHWTNLKPNTANQFEKYSLNTISHLGVDYDYASIMHYRDRAFSRNGQKTISPKKADHPNANRMGNRVSFSKLDIEKINKLYSCPTRVEPITTTKKPVEETKKGIGKKVMSISLLQKTTTTPQPKPTTEEPEKCVDKVWRCLFWSWSAVYDYCNKYAKVKYDICRRSCGTC